ncbi:MULTISPECIES: carbon-nitrogen hydrolase family protein [Legionella]|uniref:carbon-nitrogen hydrolase family protein n=1 Tax=Legionella TaxID=445 RepID=UPI000F8D04A6|nr:MULTISPECIES: carbon-nitrogen hydrolase family protein [Legionella]MCP0914507.1 carbon-nitrogen hydrolase family protein [Legionella sp. 27cVA30]RUR10445.1 carbon-nitrogen hydrolase family protein [Legionella septentrionalis]RUR16065.1 carbon-nitrogen hydrolase family protein [Legionella septentrionalis]
MGRVAVAQMVSRADVRANLSQVSELLAKAHAQDVQLIILPENFAFMGKHETDKLNIAERYGDGEIQQTISRLARKYGMWIIAGTMPIQSAEARVRSSCLVYNEQGECKARYDKIHLFDVRVSANEAHRESLTVEPGDDVVVVETPVGRIGLSVCYDLRFPELYQQLRVNGAEIFSVPSAFTATTGAAHWEILLRARAIENLCYVLAANQGGQHENGRETYGYSMIVEPWGKVLAQQKREAGIVVADIDLSRIRQLRQQFPCHEHHVLTQNDLHR